MLKKFLFSNSCHLVNTEVMTQGRLQNIQKIAFANLLEPHHDIIIPSFNFHFEVKKFKIGLSSLRKFLPN